MTSKNIFWSIVFGGLSGGLISLYFLGLYKASYYHWNHPGLVLLLPMAFLIITLFKRNSDFFPTSFKEIREADFQETKRWSRWTLPLNLFFSWLSHGAGASLGRESTSVVISTELVNVFKLDWTYWRPIVVGASFAIATGHPLIAFFVMIELFFTSASQKMLSILSAWVGVLVLKTFSVPSMMFLINYDVSRKSFFSSLFLALVIGFVCGYLARIYKTTHQWLKSKVQNHRTRLQVMLSFLVVLVVAVCIVKFDLAAFKSLGLEQFVNVQNGRITYEFVFYKMILTLICVSLGFIGGEFVPSLLIGSAIGVLLSPIFSENIGFGFALGLFTFFSGISKMKWTAWALAWAYFDFGTAMWAYFAIMIADGVSGDHKLF